MAEKVTLMLWEQLICLDVPRQNRLIATPACNKARAPQVRGERSAIEAILETETQGFVSYLPRLSSRLLTKVCAHTEGPGAEGKEIRGYLRSFKSEVT